MRGFEALIAALDGIEAEALPALTLSQFAEALARYEGLLPSARDEIAQLLSHLIGVESGA